MTNREKMIEAFYKVKNLGWVESHRRNNTSIGKTFEDYVGVVENNLNEPDLFGYEIKSHRSESSSYVTLFTKSPSYPTKGANAYLKDHFGSNYPDSKLKKLHTSIFADKFNTYEGKYSFRLLHKSDERRIYIGVYSLGGENLIDSSVYYTYDDIESALKDKLHNLFYVTAQRKYNDKNTESFLFDSAEIYTEPSLDSFLNLLDSGDIMYDIRIGSYGSGKKLGKPHDHGSGFRIKENNLVNLYSNIERI
ncbi:MvaI/BcnI family restriction endonuclease [uncultured Duncaniella sp.]|uniref:MvaI/BcnI family restriction endonuclease n=1 Tax=uncultured Duncaniella sp. TaxID=2768039 RepID=UPI0025B07A9B|nr:MvaI/BcnI family restriction endonuclease [uncultured Duncaniella sp.]